MTQKTLDKFERCLNLINRWEETDENLIKEFELLNPKLNLDNIINDFRKEIKQNFFYTSSYDEKVDILKYYIHSFFDFNEFLKKYNIIFDRYWFDLKGYPELIGDIEYINTKGELRILTYLEKYWYKCNILIQVLFNQFQSLCIIYKIDIDKICNDAWVDITHIDLSLYDESDVFPIQENIYNGFSYNLIELNYTEIQQKIICELLFKELNTKLFNTTYELFERHFFVNDFELVKITWLGTEQQLKALFKWLDEKHIIKTTDVNKLISQHFKNKRGNDFKSRQLSVVLSKSNYDFDNLKIIPPLIEKLEKLVLTFN